ncbi:hypothetical protein T4B_4540 [Trichinella pseudospiralis]|uniref:Uncharacterized protein n=1 Tax=Trichinella pseudospiralis TaxID=6337 RepID=A0A0V1HNI0_TRIPS|nr:hypothetical protein T4B_4540 [Trichinella pseudospiralis]
MAVQTKSTIKLEQTTKLAIQKANLDIVMYKFTMNIDIFFPDLLENDNFKFDRNFYKVINLFIHFDDVG